jgi:5-methyltetrahydropteroyltriglutamate--homocysteine methyltransferase
MSAPSHPVETLERPTPGAPKPKNAAPYRADHVGSLLRPAVVKQALEDFGAGKISAAERQAAEDQGIKQLIALQEAVGLKVVTDGEARRHFWHYIHVAEYKDPEVLFADLAKTFAKAVQKFYDAGCRYLQMDDIYFAYLGDEKQRELKRAEGHDPDKLIDSYAWMMHEAIKDRPADMLIGMHMCRGNFRSTWAAEGGYDAAADAIFNKTGVDLFFMEYDTDRAGGLEPLRLLAKGKQRVYPGFITTKTGALESLEMLKRRFEEASKYADLDQLGIAPQCGFSSTEHGNSITEDDQKRKLELVVETAQAIWGEA